MSVEDANSAAARLRRAYASTLATCLPHGNNGSSGGRAGRICIALSGGMDSCALLAVACELRDRHGGREVAACHVNHGLSARAERWQAFCQELCARAAVPLSLFCEKLPPAATEEQARALRLRAFAALPAAAVITAHHADDQAETVLFRLLRGGGVQSLGAINTHADLTPATNTRVDLPAAPRLLHPWLAVPRHDILHYAKARRLRWIEDEDNRNLARRRNFLRRRALPLLAQAFPNCRERLTDAGRRLREASALTRALADIDEQQARQFTAALGETPASGGDGGGGIPRAYFTAFAAAGESRLRNWLHWQLLARGETCSEKNLTEIARQIMRGKGENCRLAVFHAHALHIWRGALHWEAQPPPPPAAYQTPVALAAGEVPLPALGGCLHFRVSRGAGLSPQKSPPQLLLRLRQGGERLQMPGGHSRPLSHLLREAGVLPWQRARLPLLYAGNTLVAVAAPANSPAAIISAQYRPPQNAPGLTCTFQPSSPSSAPPLRQ